LPIATFPEQGQIRDAAFPCWKFATGGRRSGLGVFDRDGKKPLQAIPASVASDMAGMMSHVVSEGTRRGAPRLDGISDPRAKDRDHQRPIAMRGFVGYTGNFTCAVWYGNDDYSPTNRMTGRLAAGADLARHHGSSRTRVSR